MGRVLAFVKPEMKRQVLPEDFDDFIPIDKEVLTEQNWLIYAMKHYKNHNCASSNEFYQDCRHFKYLRKLMTHYERSGELKERLILNHLIILGNVLEPIPLARLLFLKIQNLSALKPFLIILSLLPKNIYNVNGRNYETDMISLDPHVVTALRNIGLR